MQRKVTFVEDSAKSQVTYLQNRIKEVVEETSQNNQAAGCLIFTQATRQGDNINMTASDKNSVGQKTSNAVTMGQLNGAQKKAVTAGIGNSMMLTVKKELDGLSQEVLAIRDELRTELNRDDALINERLTYFDEFKLQVLDQLIMWDEKTAELANLANHYYGALEEQKKLFIKLKLLV